MTKYLENKYIIDDEYKERQNELAIKLAEKSSEREKIAQKAERDSVDMKKAEFMQDKIGEEYEG